MKSPAFRVLGGVTAALTLIALPTSATAAGTAPHPVDPVPGPHQAAAVVPAPAARLTPEAAAVTGPRSGTDGAARLPFRLAVPGATAHGAYAPTKSQKDSPQLTVTVTVTSRTRCGILQLTTNGPADGIEWYTVGTFCKPGTATFRTEATRLPWSVRTLPSVRLCNGLSAALAEGDDCDDYDPPRDA